MVRLPGAGGRRGGTAHRPGRRSVHTAGADAHRGTGTRSGASSRCGLAQGLEPLPATAAYADRVTECAHTWSAGYVAHHYTRYLGDLSGGQIIRDRAEKTWGFARKGDGVRFYVFEEIANPASFKRGYRELLDAVDADELEKKRIVDECRRAFALNTAVFRELGEAFPRSA